MEENNFIWRDEYDEKIEGLVDSGKLPKSYRSAVRLALVCISEPKDSSDISLYNRYKSSIPNVPRALRAEMDKKILDGLVSEKKLSGVARDNLLKELNNGELHHGETAFTKLERETNELIDSIDFLPGGEKWEEAEHYALMATSILHELQINLKVYKSNSSSSGADPANVDLGIQYISRSLEYFPDNVNYLNIKSLLLSEGKGRKAEAIALLEKAASINPRDITIQNNLNVAKSSACFVATQVYGRNSGRELDTLRKWRDEVLMQTDLGRSFVRWYYRTGPILAEAVAGKIWLILSFKVVIDFLVYAIDFREKYLNNKNSGKSNHRRE
jgi:tetratricopeptide (TPR) repeat protein